MRTNITYNGKLPAAQKAAVKLLQSIHTADLFFISLTPAAHVVITFEDIFSFITTAEYLINSTGSVKPIHTKRGAK